MFTIFNLLHMNKDLCTHICWKKDALYNVRDNVKRSRKK